MSSYTLTLKDWFYRTTLEIANTFRYIFNIQKNKKFIIPNNYKLVFSDSFTNNYTSNWFSIEELWGKFYHPDNLRQWFNKNNIKQSNLGIELSAIVDPKYFKEIDTIIPNSVIFLASKEHWKYGIFSFTAKLPKGKYLWPALWLSGSKSWPPEMDLLEAYSENTDDYNKNKILQSNIHFKLNGEHAHAKARTHPVTKNVTEEFIEYILWWEKDFIKIYYDGYLVRHITDKVILDAMDESQRVLINSATSEGFNSDNISPFIIKNIKIYKK